LVCGNVAPSPTVTRQEFGVEGPGDDRGEEVGVGSVGGEVGGDGDEAAGAVIGGGVLDAVGGGSGVLIFEGIIGIGKR